MGLMAMLGQTNSRYIRCIKPNVQKVPSVMQHISTIEQLRCAGVVAAVTLSRSAFPNRIDNKTVKFKFSSMWDRSKFPSKGKADMEPDEKLKYDCEALLASALKDFKAQDVDEKKKIFVVGKTRSYFKMGALEYLEANRTKEMGSQVVSLQRYIRGWFVRKDYKQADNKRRKAIAKISKWYTSVKKKIAAAEMKKRDERERKAREKAEAKAKKALEARLAKEKAEREARIAREKAEEEERERLEREKEAKRKKKEMEAIEKFEKNKQKKIKKFKKLVSQKKRPNVRLELQEKRR